MYEMSGTGKSKTRIGLVGAYPEGLELTLQLLTVCIRWMNLLLSFVISPFVNPSLFQLNVVTLSVTLQQVIFWSEVGCELVD